jgi:hypothetical protein
VPKEFDLDYLVFQLAEGDITREQQIWKGKTYEDCIRFVCFKQYEAMVNERVMNSHG